MKRPLFALAAAAFGIGTTEFVIMGLLPDVAADLAVSTPEAGLLVSGYAIGVAVGAPLLAIATARWPRKRALVALMVLFVIGNLCCALAPGYAWLMAARVVTAFCHAAFFGIGAVVAAQIVEPHRRAQAVALMFTGLTLANVLGVPFGTALGHAAGWRSTFWVVAAIGVAAVAALQAWLPRQLPMQGGSILREFRALVGARIQLALLISTVSSASLFSVFTYIAYILRDVGGFVPPQESWALLVFGAGITLGGLIGGRLADWKLLPALAALCAGTVLVLALFAWTSHYRLPTLVTLFAWGIVCFAIVPGAQLNVIEQARAAPNLASTLNQGAFNLGNAIGAWFGGLAIGSGLPLAALPWLGSSLAVVALAAVLGAGRLQAHAAPGTPDRPT